MTEQTYLIVGTGLAGLTLARTLEAKGISFILIGETQNHSSTVAAGLINPMVFRRTKKSWRVAEFLPFAKNYYQDIERLIDKEVFRELTIRRSFAHEQERKDWLKKQDLPSYSDYLATLTEEDDQYQKVLSTCGTARVKQAAHILVENYILGLRNYYLEKKQWRQERIDYSQIDLEKSTYQDIHFQKIIFCEGHEVTHNPWFSYLPMKLTKGEILDIASTELPQDESANRKCFVLPLGEGKFKVGSTYEWDDLSIQTSTAAQEEILDKLTSLTEEKVSVLGQYVGIRPTVSDRRPLMGIHPIQKNIAIFNGLGTKGYLMAPLLAHEFVAYLSTESTLDPESDIRRFDELNHAE